MHEPAQIFCAYKKTVVRNAHCERSAKARRRRIKRTSRRLLPNVARRNVASRGVRIR